MSQTKVDEAIELLRGLPPQDVADVVWQEAAALTAVDFSTVVQRLLAARTGASRASEVGTVLSAYLTSETQVEMLAGQPVDIVDHLSDHLRRIALLSTARRAVLAETMLESTAVGEALGSTSTNAREAASILRRSGRLLGVKVQNRYLYPAFQFDFGKQELREVAGDVNRLLEALEDPWGVASWWVTSNARLEGAAPRELLGTDRERDLLELASAETDE